MLEKNIALLRVNNTSLLIRDILLLVGLYIFPKLSQSVSILSFFDELIFLFMINVILLRILYLKYIFTKFDILLLSYLLYSFFLIFYNHLPMGNMMQIFLTSKFIIIYLYFNSMNEQYKAELFLLLFKVLFIIFFISIILSVLQFTIPEIMHSYSHDRRGILGIIPGGIFGSRVLFSEFLLIFIVLLFSFKRFPKDSFELLYRFKYYIFFIVFILVFLTFSRKELVLLTLFIPILFYDKISTSSKPIFYMLLIFSLFLMAFTFITVFADINEKTFTDKQIRFHIYLYAMDIFQYYFPFGSGPGTYGSIMSMQYQDVYEQFEVSSRIVGTDEKRGPIFDLFLISLLAEYGLGWIFFILLFISMTFTRANNYLSVYLNFTKLKVLFFILIVGLSIFVPILLNWIGFLMFSILALISNKGKYNAHSN